MGWLARAALALGLLLAWPSLGIAREAPPTASSSQPAARPDPRFDHPRVCRTLRRQIAHFEGVADRARSRDAELWERATEQHLERLRTRQRARCPSDVPPNLLRKLGTALRKAGRMALSAMALGAL